ncbi:ATPase WRNIP1-like [Phymastichus coffea]|uniref:ATPase WRNIP1-like n=1 Tax=Phymastichus coffea TaxID=108790 RepID=UPI00273BA6F8|nr:ATPase WRNIP1-like [Phymastichus coffea]
MTTNGKRLKRLSPFTSKIQESPPSKKSKTLDNIQYQITTNTNISNTNISMNNFQGQTKTNSNFQNNYAPLAEKMRPQNLNDYIGQKHLLGPNTLLNDLLKNGEIPSMILWGPPGCGKTSLINVIIQESKRNSDIPIKFIKLSATTAGINDVKKAVTEAEIQLKQNKRTIVFMDEVHRFNKLQQDVFLPYVESGTFTLIGATTENPSFSLNSALLSRCRVFVLKKLSKEDIIHILLRAIELMGGEVGTKIKKKEQSQMQPKFFIDIRSIEWLAEVCDGDARIALGGLEMAVEVKVGNNYENINIINLSDIKSHLEIASGLSDSKSSNVNHLYNALHHSIIGNNDNAALYWLARILECKEDPVLIAQRLVNIATENIAFDNDLALDMAMHTLDACKMIGMPESDVMLAQCVLYLTRAEKCRKIPNALIRAQCAIENYVGPQPKVPLFIKDTTAQGKLKATQGANYKNILQQENLEKNHLPFGMENADFFQDSS